ncbi:secretion protein HlyD [Selenomonas dianae]|nr:secretion protein HlyD [Selenomonas dianae]WLD81798.1 secretion protein HlyD [Selenomonas dianae]
MRRFFRPNEEANRTHSKGYVEDLLTKFGQKRCAKMARLNLSVLPKIDSS